MSSAPRLGPGIGNSVITPLVVILPMRRAPASVNHERAVGLRP